MDGTPTMYEQHGANDASAGPESVQTRFAFCRQMFPRVSITDELDPLFRGYQRGSETRARVTIRRARPGSDINTSYRSSPYLAFTT
jgi:hypothetical protein